MRKSRPCLKVFSLCVYIHKSFQHLITYRPSRENWLLTCRRLNTISRSRIHEISHYYYSDDSYLIIVSKEENEQEPSDDEQHGRFEESDHLLTPNNQAQGDCCKCYICTSITTYSFTCRSFHWQMQFDSGCQFSIVRTSACGGYSGISVWYSQCCHSQVQLRQ